MGVEGTKRIENEVGQRFLQHFIPTILIDIEPICIGINISHIIVRNCTSRHSIVHYGVIDGVIVVAEETF